MFTHGLNWVLRKYFYQLKLAFIEEILGGEIQFYEKIIRDGKNTYRKREKMIYAWLLLSSCRA